MSFIGSVKQGTVYAPGYFLANNDENVVRETREIPQTGATTAGGGKYHKMGEVYPANNSTAEGFLYEDVDVTEGNMPGSVVTGNATIVKDRIPLSYDQLTGSCLTALGNRGFKFVDEADVTRPNWVNS